MKREAIMENLVNYAIAYANHGFSVLPMVNKRPLIEFADQPPLTVSEIKRIWKHNPFAQIALRTIDFFVIDIDVHEVNGYKSLKKYQHKDLIIPTLAQRTGSGGEQLFYKKRNDIEISQNIGWLPGVDIKAHINNYVMVAPSQNHGNKYKWLNNRSMATPSKELLLEINKDKPSDYKPEDLKFTGKRSTTTELFEEIINGLGETGGRNNALASFIGGLLFRNVDAQITYQLAKLANEHTPKALSAKEFDRTFESMVKKEIKRREQRKQWA